MKVGILTHYDVNNQGAQLQMYSMYEKLKEFGHAPVILTYNKNYDFNYESKLKNQISLKSIPYIGKKYLLDKGIGLTSHNIKKYQSNKKFREEHFKFEHYATADIDMAIVGSDEVLSLESGVNMMMYGHGVNTNNMMTYAPSFGQTDMLKIEKHHCRNLISSGLSTFSSLSARDENTANLIFDLTGRDVKLVCDPVILFDFKKTKTQTSTPKEKYLVVYAYDRHMIEENEINSIKQYAKENNLITVSPGTYHSWCDKNIVCNALEWLEIFRGAEAVITDTFHGTIVSAIANIPVAVYVRKQINSKKLSDLIVRLGISNRKLSVINKLNLNKVFSEMQDFENLNLKIDELRNEGNNYLIESINLIQKTM